MATHITKETIEHLAKLARIELTAEEKEKLLVDLKKILNHFEELKELDTSAVLPMNGGTSLRNIFREDDASEGTNKGAGLDAFPKSEKGFLVVPPVFEQ